MNGLSENANDDQVSFALTVDIGAVHGYIVRPSRVNEMTELQKTNCNLKRTTNQKKT